MKGPIHFLLGLAWMWIGQAPVMAQEIPVVHTWSELFAHPQIAVQADHVIPPEGTPNDPKKVSQVQVWIGIDRDHSTANGAVVLYCLSKGMCFAGTSDQNLGPFRVVVKSPDHDRPTDLARALASPNQNLRDSTFVLSALTVTLAQAGDYEIDLVPRMRMVDGKPPAIVAKVIVTATGDPVLPWSPWDGALGMSPRGLTNTPADSTFVTGYVSNPAGGIAVPKAPQSPFIYAAAPLSGVLPQLIPDAPDPATQLSMEGNDFLLAASGLPWSEPQDDCLTRWWINGKPWVPGLDARESASMAGFGAVRAGHPKGARFVLQFHPEALGAVKGDRIGVQMLACPGGFERCGPQQAIKMLSDLIEQETGAPPTNFSSMSNRIEFVYSGDPKNPRQP